MRDIDPDEGDEHMIRLVLPEVESVEVAPLDLRTLVLQQSSGPATLLVFSEARPLVTIDQVDRSVAVLEPGVVVVATAPVTDTVRDEAGEIVDRSLLVEVCAPLVVAADVAVLLARHDEPLSATVTGLLEAALGVGARLVVIADDGSGHWAGRPDHLGVARARVGP